MSEQMDVLVRKTFKHLNYDNELAPVPVFACSTKTSAPFSTPSPFFCTHRPKRISCPTPTTSTADRALLPFAVSPSFEAQMNCETVLREEVRICSELTTPRAGIEPMSENDLSFASSFHSRISPSHEPSQDGLTFVFVSQRLRTDQRRRSLNNAGSLGPSPNGACEPRRRPRCLHVTRQSRAPEPA